MFTQSQMKRGRSEANPLPPQADTILDAKWSLPVKGELPAEKLWRWWLEERLYRFSCENKNIRGKENIRGKKAVCISELSICGKARQNVLIFRCFRGQLWKSRPQAPCRYYRDEDLPSRWAPRQLSPETDCIVHSQQKLNNFYYWTLKQLWGYFKLHLQIIPSPRIYTIRDGATHQTLPLGAGCFRKWGSRAWYMGFTRGVFYSWRCTFSSLETVVQGEKKSYQKLH